MTMKRMVVCAGVLGVVVLAASVLGAHDRRAGLPADAQGAQAGNPVVVIETLKGAIEIELYAKDAPKTVDRLLELFRTNFYRGQRFHRVEPNFLIQAGDPATRDFTKRARWGAGGSGRSIGVAEIVRRHRHVRGAVGMAHAGNAAAADSQFYIMRAARSSLDGKYTIVGRVLSGMDVVDRTALNDMIRKAYVKGEGQRP
jgi:peptidyl-prolyl cis-trans isomerase B (cyclophilin B)